MSDRQQAPSAANWERYIAATIFLTLILTQYFLTFMLGIVIFLVYRRDYRYLTYHSLLAALWQLSVYVIQGLFHSQFSHIGVRLQALIKANPHVTYKWFVFNPWQWGHLSQMEQLAMMVVLASFVMNVLIMLWGSALTLHGRVVRLPVLSSLCEKMLPALAK